MPNPVNLAFIPGPEYVIKAHGVSPPYRCRTYRQACYLAHIFCCPSCLDAQIAGAETCCRRPGSYQYNHQSARVDSGEITINKYSALTLGKLQSRSLGEARFLTGG